MTTGKTILIVVLVIIGVLTIAGFSVYFWAQGVWDKINFGKPVPTALDLNGLTLTDVANIFLSGTQKDVYITLSFPIKNDSNSDITVSKFRMTLYYQNEIIGTTSDKLYNDSTLIPANSTKTITDTVTVKLNQAGVNLVKDKFAGKKPEIVYTIDINVFGLPVSTIYPIKDSFLL